MLSAVPALLTIEGTTAYEVRVTTAHAQALLSSRTEYQAVERELEGMHATSNAGLHC